MPKFRTDSAPHDDGPKLAARLLQMSDGVPSSGFVRQQSGMGSNRRSSPRRIVRGALALTVLMHQMEHAVDTRIDMGRGRDAALFKKTACTNRLRSIVSIGSPPGDGALLHFVGVDF